MRLFLLVIVIFISFTTTSFTYAITSDEIDRLLSPIPVEPSGFIMKNENYILELKQITPETTEKPVKQTINILSSTEKKMFEKQKYIITNEIDKEIVMYIDTDLIIFDTPAGKQIIEQPANLRAVAKEQVPFQIATISDGPLSSVTGREIPPTNCDGGNQSCSTNKPARWHDDTSYGWGISVERDGNSTTYYQPLSSTHPLLLTTENHLNTFNSVSLSFKIITQPDSPDSLLKTSVLFLTLP